MIDLEERLRRGLDAAAATQDQPPTFEARVARRIAVVRRRRTVARGALAAVVVAATVAGIAVMRHDSAHQTTFAGDPIGEPGWHPMAAAPIVPRFQAVSVAMGDRALVWGGYTDHPVLDGAVYDATHNRWTNVPAAPFALGDAVGAWTGREVIIVSGDGGDVSAAAYDPETNAWRTLATPPLTNGASALNHAVWTGTELVVVGEADGNDDGAVSQVAIYDPAADTWRTGPLPSGPLPSFGDAVWTGTEIAVVGWVNGSGVSKGSDTLQLYDPATNRWREIGWGLDGVRDRTTVAWTGSQLFIGGGSSADGILRDAALVDVATGAWDRVPDAPVAFTGNFRYGELWTGSAVLTLNGDGGLPVAFDPATRTWQLGPASPIGDHRDEVAWTWLDARHLAVVWSGGLSSDDRHTCCTPIDSGETYTP